MFLGMLCHVIFLINDEINDNASQIAFYVCRAVYVFTILRIYRHVSNIIYIFST